METAFRIFTRVTILQASSAFAESGTGGAGVGLIGWLFIGFVALIVAFQFIPATMMFGSMMAAIFGKTKSREVITGNAKSNNA